MSIANALTFIRIFLSPVFLVIFVQREAIGIPYVALPYILLSLFLISELSDAFDGYFARKLNQVTDLGKILDPMADSITRIAYFLAFTTAPINIPIIYVFVMFYRDSVTSTLRTVCALRGFALAARPSGKLKAILQAVAVFMILVLLTLHSLTLITTDALQHFSHLIVMVTCVYSVLSAIDYLYVNWPHVRNLLYTSSSTTA